MRSVFNPFCRGAVRTAIIASTFLAAPSLLAGDLTSELREQIGILASDDFEGRQPGTEGEKKTLAFIEEYWKSAGLKPGAAGGSWLQPVPLVERTAGRTQTEFRQGSRVLRFAAGDIILSGSKERQVLADTPVMFGGYGVNAEGEVIPNVKDRIVLIFRGGGDDAPKNLPSAGQRSRALTEAGAAATIFIAGSEAEWQQLREIFGRKTISRDDGTTAGGLGGAVASEFAVGLVTAAGHDWDELNRKARSADFTGMDLGISGNLVTENNVRKFESYNVIGKIPGRKKDAGALLFMAHWDHLGICRPGKEDSICNGAVDNASGIAVMNLVAEGLARKKYDRDIYFVATTAEESGLLGAYAFADNPAVPLDKIKMALNIDTIAIAPAGTSVAIMGRGQTGLDSHIDRIARKLGREINEGNDADILIQRQDGWALARKNVPVVMVGGAISDLGLIQTFLAGPYHGPDDELTDSIELGGAAEDTRLYVELARYFADTRKYRGN